MNYRITPAYTGNTKFSFKIETIEQDHPRIHGEHLLRDLLHSLRLGSPPHTRGTPIGNETHIDGLRITPAYTGNTVIRSLHSYIMQDHPRIHGEHRNNIHLLFN